MDSQGVFFHQQHPARGSQRREEYKAFTCKVKFKVKLTLLQVYQDDPEEPEDQPQVLSGGEHIVLDPQVG